MDLQSEQARRCLGQSYKRQGRYDLAQAEFEAAAALRPTVEVLGELIEVYTRQKKIDRCVAANARYWELEGERDLAENRGLEAKLRALARPQAREREFKAKIIRTPWFEPAGAYQWDFNYSLLLPLGMGRIVSYLRANGLAVDQDDLHVKLNHALRFGPPEDKPDSDVFFDERRILDYVGGRSDAGVDAVLADAEARCGVAGYDAILLSLTADIRNLSGVMFTLAFARYLKERHGPVVIVGGFERRETDALLRYRSPHIDFVGRHSGEKLLFLVLTALKHGVPVDRLPGAPLEIQGKELIAARPPFAVNPDYSGLPLPLYEFQKPGRVSLGDPELAGLLDEFNRSRTLVSPHMLMEGCFHGCIFCSCSDTSRVFCLSPREAAAQLLSLKERFGVKNFFFLNRMINLSRRYVNEFCDELMGSRAGILWADCARADNLDRDTLVKMRAAGCVRLIYGLEVASPRLLEYIDKRVQVERLEDILRWTDEAGILSGLEIISGFPGETREDAQLTVDFLERNRSRLDMIYYNMLYIEKSSRLYRHPERYGISRFFEAPAGGPAAGNMQVGYDELGGLKWEDKLKDMRRNFDYIVEKTARPSLPYFEVEHLIFFLYSKFRDKRKIAGILERLAVAH